MKKLLLATRNKGKVREIQALLADSGVKVLSLSDYPDIPDIPEDGATFEENAVFKAQEVARLTGEITLADDSGLEVDALNGEPGVHSARFAGETKNDEANNTKLIALLEDVPPAHRTARFRCVIALVTPDGYVHTADDACEGLIILKPRGDNGFGYDPLFYVPEYDQTFAELPLDIKNRISHRGRALAQVKDLVRQVLA